MQYFNVIVTIIISLTALSFPVFFIISIVKFFELKKITNLEEKKSLKKKAWKILFFPIVFALFMVVVWGLVGIIHGVIQP